MRTHLLRLPNELSKLRWTRCPVKFVLSFTSCAFVLSPLATTSPMCGDPTCGSPRCADTRCVGSRYGDVRQACRPQWTGNHRIPRRPLFNTPRLLSLCIFWECSAGLTESHNGSSVVPYGLVFGFLLGGLGSGREHWSAQMRSTLKLRTHSYTDLHYDRFVLDLDS